MEKNISIGEIIIAEPDMSPNDGDFIEISELVAWQYGAAF